MELDWVETQGMLEAASFQNMLEDEHCHDMKFVVMADGLIDYASGERYPLVGEASVIRRVQHTLNWCLTHRTSHHYEQVVFGLSDDPADIRCRHFSFFYTDEHVELVVSSLMQYNDRVISGAFESILFNSLSDAVVLTEADKVERPGPRIVYCNTTFLTMTGYQKSEVLGRSPRFLQGNQTCDLTKQTIRSSLDCWKTFKKTLTNFRKNGEAFDVELHISPVMDETGWYSHWISVQRDVSGHKQMFDHVKRSNLILRSSKIGCWYYNFTQDILYWDELMHEIHPSDNERSVKSLADWSDILDEEYRDSFSFAVIRAISGESNIDAEYRLTLASGEIRWIRIKAELVDSELDNTSVLSGICFDISTEKASLIAIENHRKVAEQKAKLASLGEIAAGIGHEINNPLSVITSSLDLMELDLHKGITNLAQFDDTTKKMRVACERINHIVDGLQSATSVASGPSELSSINLLQSIHQTVAMLTQLYAQEAIAVTLNVMADEEACYIHAEHSGVQQILANLLNNSKYAVRDARKKHIEIRISATDDICLLSVIDSGTGIAKEMLGRVFEPFSTDKPVGEGTGLGLSICKNLIESFGGEINFTTNEKGSRFSCRFLRSNAPVKQQSRDDIAYLPATVLVVEDDASTGKSTVAILEAIGCTCTLAQNGAEALDILHKTKSEFDIVLTDLKMPILNGVELLQTVRHKGLAQSAHKYIMTEETFSLMDDNYQQVSSLAKDIVKKPLSRSDLARIVNTVSER